MPCEFGSAAASGANDKTKIPAIARRIVKTSHSASRLPQQDSSILSSWRAKFGSAGLLWGTSIAGSKSVATLRQSADVRGKVPAFDLRPPVKAEAAGVAFRSDSFRTREYSNETSPHPAEYRRRADVVCGARRRLSDAERSRLDRARFQISHWRSAAGAAAALCHDRRAF